MAKARAEVRITGRVQGVWFRQSTRQTAAGFAVTGWVRNNPDGSVEAVFEGEEAAVKAVINWCQTGPELARVDSVSAKWRAATGEFAGFAVY